MNKNINEWICEYIIYTEDLELIKSKFLLNYINEIKTNNNNNSINLVVIYNLLLYVYFI